MSQNQSDIKELQDQLFLDTADGANLNVVTGNLGLDRPTLGYTDDLWRAIAKAIALQPKTTTIAFHKALEAALGPKTTKIVNIDEDSQVGDELLICDGADDITQLGTLIIDPGLATEETVSFSYREKNTGKVFLTSPLTKVHSPVEYGYGYASSVSGTTITMYDSSRLPTTGYPYSIVVDRGLPSEELLVVTDNDLSTNTLTLQDASVVAHLVPRSKFLAKILNNTAASGSEYLLLDNNDTANFPDTGWLRINFGQMNEEVVEYIDNLVDDNAFLLRLPTLLNHAVNEPIELVTPGSFVESISAVQQGAGWDVFQTEPNKVFIYVPPVLETFRLLDVSYLHYPGLSATTTLAVATAVDDTTVELTDSSDFPHVGIVDIDGVLKFYIANDTDTNILTLSEAVGTVIGDGETVSLANVDEGNLYDLSGDLVYGSWPGPYLYDFNQQEPSIISTTLAETKAPPTTVAFAQIAGATALEVFDASLYPAPPFDPFLIRIGRSSGFSEDRNVTDRTLKSTTDTQVDTNTGSGSLTLPGVDNSDFPESDGVNPARYRIIVDEGGAHEEVLLVLQNDVGTNTFSLNSATVEDHDAGEIIRLLHDVLTVDELEEAHDGPADENGIYNLGHLVEVLSDSFEVLDASAFPEEGTFWLNFGKGRTNARDRIVTASGTDIELVSTEKYPTTGYPYQIVVGQGTFQEEIAFVTNNDTGTNTLELQTPLTGTFGIYDYVTFTSGTPVTIGYDNKDGNVLELSEAIVLESVYTEGESVVYSPGLSIPSEFGTDYALRMPPTNDANLQYLFDLIRAAGVEVTIIDHK